jgi:hypothetical protein
VCPLYELFDLAVFRSSHHPVLLVFCQLPHQHIRDVYNRLYHNFLGSYDDIVRWGLAESVDATSAAVLKALSSSSPPDRCLLSFQFPFFVEFSPHLLLVMYSIVVGLDAWFLTFATRWLPVPIFDAINRFQLLKPIEQMNKE